MEQTLQWLRGGAEECSRAQRAMERMRGGRESGERLAEVAHDARNMVAALSVFCDLLQEPGVLVRRFAHYARELRLVTAASRRLVEKMADLEAPELGDKRKDAEPGQEFNRGSVAGAASPMPHSIPGGDPGSGLPIANLAEELLANRNLLAALAGPSITLTMEAGGGGLQAWITGDDLTRVLVNLVKNAAEAMPQGGQIRIAVSEPEAKTGDAQQVRIAVEDSGPGIPEELLERIFDRGFTTRQLRTAEEGGGPGGNRGLGLTISRSIVEQTGGTLTAMNRRGGGARLEMALPVAAGYRISPSRRPMGFVVS